MRTQCYTDTRIGELVVAAFDEAARHSTDPHEVSRLATKAVVHMLLRLRDSQASGLPRVEITH